MHIFMFVTSHDGYWILTWILSHAILVLHVAFFIS